MGEDQGPVVLRFLRGEVVSRADELCVRGMTDP